MTKIYYVIKNITDNSYYSTSRHEGILVAKKFSSFKNATNFIDKNLSEGYYTIEEICEVIDES